MSKINREELAAEVAKLLGFIDVDGGDWYDGGGRVYNQSGTDVTPTPEQVSLLRNVNVDLVAAIKKLASFVAPK